MTHPVLCTNDIAPIVFNTTKWLDTLIIDFICLNLIIASISRLCSQMKLKLFLSSYAKSSTTFPVRRVLRLYHSTFNRVHDIWIKNT